MNERLPLPLFIRQRDWHPAPLGPTLTLATDIVTTAPDFGRPDTMTSDASKALNCRTATSSDYLRQIHRAWHAEGQGFTLPR